MGTNRFEKRKLLNYLVISIIVAIANITLYSSTIGLALVGAEIIILLFFLFTKRYVDFFCMYTIFLSFCLEFSDFVDASSFYNLKDIRLFGLNLGIWIGLPPLLLFVINYRNIITKIKRLTPTFYKFGKSLILINFVAVIVGFFLILFNDNDVNSFSNVFVLFFGETYQFMFLPVIFFSGISLAVAYDRNNTYKISLTIEAMLWACVFQQIVSYVFRINASYGGTTIALLSNISAFVPLMMVFLGSDKCIYPRITGLLGIVGTVLCFLTGVGGKGIILAALMLVIVEIQLIRSTKLVLKLVGLIFPIIAVIAAIVVVNMALGTDGIFAWKLFSVRSVFDFGPNWISNMAHSPRIRIGEVINVLLEYAHKPWLIITGKGFLGTVKDYSGIWVNETISYSAFTSEEWYVGAFYSMHEITSYFLVFGGLGVRYLLRYLKYVKRNYVNNSWLLFGAYWFLVYYGFSFTIASFGCLVFFYSICYTDFDMVRKKVTLYVPENPSR